VESAANDRYKAMGASHQEAVDDRSKLVEDGGDERGGKKPGTADACDDDWTTNGEGAITAAPPPPNWSVMFLKLGPRYLKTTATFISAVMSV
jgi:hypothetical protein